MCVVHALSFIRVSQAADADHHAALQAVRDLIASSAAAMVVPDVGVAPQARGPSHTAAGLPAADSEDGETAAAWTFVQENDQQGGTEPPPAA